MFTANSPRWNARKKGYPENWSELSRECKERANWHCELCGIAHGSTRISKQDREYKVWLSACHVRRNDESNPNPELIALCVTCHGRFDVAYKAAMATAKLERLRLRIARQKKLALKQA